MVSKVLKISAWLRDRPATIAGVIGIFIVLFYAYGCDSKTKSVLYPERKVTRAELQIEIDTMMQLAKFRMQDLDKQDEFKQWLFQQTIIVAQGGAVNPVGILTSLVGLLGIGATADNVRLRKQRKKILKKVEKTENDAD